MKRLSSFTPARSVLFAGCSTVRPQARLLATRASIVRSSPSLVTRSATVSQWSQRRLFATAGEDKEQRKEDEEDDKQKDKQDDKQQDDTQQQVRPKQKITWPYWLFLAVALPFADIPYFYFRPIRTEPALDKDEFREFSLIEVEDVTPNTRRLRFALPSKWHVLGLPVASAILVKAPLGENGKPVLRPYTPVTSDKTDKGYFDLVIKNYPNGVMSSHIYNLKKGETIQVKGPLPKLPYQKNMKKHLGMLAGGTGITPMLQVVEEVLRESDDKTHVSLVFANNTEQDIILKDRLDGLAKKHPNFEVHYVVTEAKNPSEWTGHIGFVTPDIISECIPGPSEDVMVFVCGPPPFYNALSGPKAKDYTQGELSGALKELGYTKEQVYKF